jgi:FMN-dependent NADH-azoreductase
MLHYLKKLLSRQIPTQPKRSSEALPMTILHIDSSILGPNSVSRALTSEIVARQLALNPGAKVIYRDLETDAALHLSGAHLAVFQGGTVTNPTLGADLAVGSAYLDDLFAADIIVIGAPMYNFSIPSQLKAWIDRVVVAGKTFQYTANGPEGLLPKGKKVFIASSRGGVYTGDSPAAVLEHHETYLRGVLSFIGLTDITVIRAEGLGLGQDVRDTSLAKAKAEIAAIAA